VADHKKARVPCSEAQLGSQSSALDGLKTMLAPERQQPFEIREDHIQSLLLARRARDELLGEDLFSDPAWDLLLELYAAELGRRPVTVQDLVLATGTPASIAERWLSALAERGLVIPSGRAGGGARISLSAEGLSKLERLARRWGAAFVSI
jgi:DNA-binding transcriptional ArsR family regulator